MSLKDKPVTTQLGPSDQKLSYECVEDLEQLPARGRVKHAGYVQSVSYSAPNEAPLLTAVVVDRLGTMSARRGTVPHVRLIFMGQKSVPGIKPGVKVEYSGMVALVEQIPTIFNPRYVIVPEARG
ncbi:hypothetical protein [Glutamicibacter arilaitensis]|jgi:hypothetical protein|uniref:Uncharacterized protein n=1 Tax=Glutamicibacter arilaitensis (strain DSM 16368 / CIP 108037 / IAM 15318 / JCM 13566 / NCIMB 14258 / Re117) TaxID=861360 RepID=A0ABM9PY01_GLUAR|nr:hypothetical protein AARI_20050 [Glutamicibacter arilaitensis Re117]HCJ54791.1 hypothetical protein [Glutamicibacter sp.]HCM94375.1 hypothetical protein [Glutamicibacter sp.]